MPQSSLMARLKEQQDAGNNLTPPRPSSINSLGRGAQYQSPRSGSSLAAATSGPSYSGGRHSKHYGGGRGGRGGRGGGRIVGRSQYNKNGRDFSSRSPPTHAHETPDTPLEDAPQITPIQQRAIKAQQAADAQRISDLQGQNENLTTSNATLQKDLSALQTSYDGLYANFTQVNGETEVLRANYDRLYGNFNQIYGEKEDLQANCDRLNRVMESLHADHDQLGTEKETIQEDYNQLNGEKEALEEKIDQLHREKEHIQESYNRLSGNIEALRKNHDRLYREKEKFQENYDKLNQEKVALQQKSEQLSAHQATLEENIASLRGKNEKLKDALKKCLGDMEAHNVAREARKRAVEAENQAADSMEGTRLECMDLL